MASSDDDTILPPRRPVNFGGLDGDTVLPQQNAAGIHVPGDVIDNRYTVIREIGRGGMGVVYEVEDDITGDRYAVKRLLPEYAQRPEIVKLFRTEGAASMRFTHQSRHFVSTQTMGLDGGSPYIVMQLIRHPTLRMMIREADNGMSIDNAITILSDVATALAELHSLGIIHRDLKPENIFVSSHDAGGYVMLGDFGLSKDGKEATITFLRGAGTDRYVSPEQHKGLPTGAHTDTYSFGVIAYEVLTGHLPEFGDRLSDFKTNVPEFLDSMISNCISARVDRRPVDGKMLVDMLAVHHESRDKSSLITRNSAQGQRKSTSNVIHSHLTKYPHLAAYMRSLQSIPAGEYVMGSDAGYADERPQHTVKVSRFRLGKTPVTNALWREYVSGLSQEHTNPQMAGQLDDHPVVNVSWEDVMGQDGNGGFCRWISENAGFRLTLPTEARFEYASRSGNSDSEYPWGNYYEDVFAWTSVVTKRTTTGPVSRRNCIYTNDFGLTDMVGNVWQLCFDRYGSYPSDSTTDPTGPACINGKNRCKRGGSWLHNYSGYVRSSLRHQIPPNHRCGQTGFRLAAEAG